MITEGYLEVTISLIMHTCDCLWQSSRLVPEDLTTNNCVCYSSVHGFRLVGFSSGRLGESHYCSDIVMFRLLSSLRLPKCR
jgi:hypothetical protein